MAMPPATPTSPPSAQVVGNAFVEQYYHILHHSPEFVYRFYQESSVLSRQDSNGVMTSVTTMKSINEKICSLDYKNYKAEIKTADAQDSFKDGVIVLVTGCLTGKDNLKRKFAQTFFLAPQDKGYFVLNDVFRYVENEADANPETVNGTDGTVASHSEPTHMVDPLPVEQAISRAEEVQNGEEQHSKPVENENQAENEILVEVEPHSPDNNNSSVPEPASYISEEDAPKKSYASIVSSQTKKGPTRIYVPANTPKVAATKTQKQSVDSVAQGPAPEVSASASPSGATVTESKDVQDEVEGHSIYVRNLPLTATAAQLEAEFKRFGPIKQGGVQVRSNRQQGFCFGFVEFQDLSSMHSAIQASPITIGGRQAVVEMKRTTTRVGGGNRGRFPSGQGGYWNDSFRGRGNFRGGRGYGRNDFGSRAEFSVRDRGQGGRGGEGYQQSRGRGGRRGGSYQNAAAA